jgi:hypothetical protein
MVDPNWQIGTATIDIHIRSRVAPIVRLVDTLIQIEKKKGKRKKKERKRLSSVMEVRVRDENWQD